MTSPRGLAAALAAAGLAVGVAACGSGSSSAGSERPAHRPISVIYVAGQPAGPWAARTEGLSDGVKLAIAERNGLVGERAVSTAVVPVVQRDGAQLNAAIGAGRILRDSRTLAVLATYTAPQLALSAPQLNGGEIALLQYGTGMLGLLQPELPGEPDRYQPSGRNFALRGVPSDGQVAAAVNQIPGVQKADVVAQDGTYRRSISKEGQALIAAAQKAYAKAISEGKTGADLPSRLPGYTQSFWPGEVSDAARLATRIRQENRGVIRPVSEANGAQVFVIDPTQPDPVADARGVARRSKGTLVLVDAADRGIPASAVSGHDGAVYRVRRTLDDATTSASQAIRAKERSRFGRDRGDAVVAGYRAAERILDLAAHQPSKTINRVDYATALVGDAPNDPNLPAKAGEVQLGSVVVERLSGGRWVSAN